MSLISFRSPGKQIGELVMMNILLSLRMANWLISNVGIWMMMMMLLVMLLMMMMMRWTKLKGVCGEML